MSTYHSLDRRLCNFAKKFGALGIGHGALGIGHGALGMGHWALGRDAMNRVCTIVFLVPFPYSPHSGFLATIVRWRGSLATVTGGAKPTACNVASISKV